MIKNIILFLLLSLFFLTIYAGIVNVIYNVKSEVPASTWLIRFIFLVLLYYVYHAQ